MTMLDRPIDGPNAGTGGCTLCDCPSWLNDGREPPRCAGSAPDGATCGHSENDHR